MSVALPHRTDGDGCSQVSLAELIALRERIARTRAAPLLSRAARSGQQSSRLYGRGMDYAESRIYQAGDDVRRLDWRLTARSGKLHTKLFQEDREGCLLILLDTHASMRFGTRVRFKSVQAARSAAVAAWYAVRAGERVGVMAFGHAEQLLRPQAGSRGALAVCGALAAWDAQATSGKVEPLSDALTRASRVLHGASRVLLISDGFSCDTPARQRLLDLTRHAGVSVLVVADALELSLAPPGRYPLEHAGERSEVLLQSERQRSEFQSALGAGPARLGELAKSLGLRCNSIDTAIDPLDAVTALFGGARPGR
ncbi:DUF58 domain-containing protein [Rhodanobacter glycinis]|uniref:DUF58 domain-containing protein n=1 Tax=Rhodanobacter glycinis TaxID=582702 RepID=A0A502FDL3_9GAMM|nr:DUF58 domain-containing protein [Rhodanobacter glycinis]TPG11725.1 DUF58 domain-containing protein [Rhodanobacter glycinis]TPG47421.1 DUF58 domain-containing protein [Rhodanobacter glycinis]